MVRQVTLSEFREVEIHHLHYMNWQECDDHGDDMYYEILMCLLATNTIMVIITLYFTAHCTKFFQLLLGEVNDCTEWRVSNM